MNLGLIFKTIAAQEQPLLIALQGASCSGKSTFANSLEEYLKNNEFNVMKIGVDSYYKAINPDPEVIKKFDFDNPAAIDWDLMRKTFDDLRERRQKVTLNKIDYVKCTSESYQEENSYPDVIIFEGIYALNLFNKKIFNVEKYDCMKLPSQEISEEYIDNPDDFSQDFNIVRIFFKIDKETMFKIRLERDIKEGRHKLAKEESREKFVEYLTPKFDQKIWPSTERWVNFVEQANFIVPSGSRNLEACEILRNGIFSWLKCKNEKSKDGEKISD